jgi:hypothetical protein
MTTKTPALFENDKEADDVLWTPLLSDTTIAAQMREMWELFHPYADETFVHNIRKAVRDLRDEKEPGNPVRAHAEILFHRAHWEMTTAVALLQQGIELVPRAKWNKAWKGAGPDLWAIVNGRNVWIECVVPGAGTGADAVPEMEGDMKVRSVPVAQMNLRLLSVFKDKREKWAKYIAMGITKLEDSYIVAINGRAMPFGHLDDDPPWMARVLYGLGWFAVNVNTDTGKFSDAYLTAQPSIPKASKEEIDSRLFATGAASEVCGVMYSSFNAWNPASTPAIGMKFIHNPTATYPLPERWLPDSFSYNAKFNGDSVSISQVVPEDAIAAAKKQAESKP